MKKLWVAGALAGALLLTTGCESERNISEEQKQNQQLKDESDRKTGMPNITNFFEKNTLKKIYELRDNPDLTTYSYTKNDMTGKYVYLGQSIGYGVPYSTQYSNPEQIVQIDGESTYTVEAFMPQAEPNGLFVAEGMSATWVILNNPETKQQEVVYVESELTVTQSKLDKRLVESWSLPSNY